MSTELLSSVYALAAKRLNIDVSDFEVNGEPLRTKLKFKFHKAYRVSRDIHDRQKPFPLHETTSITTTFRSPIVFHDLKRRDNKRNYTLSMETGSFIFIIANPKLPPVETPEDLTIQMNARDAEKRFIDDILKAQPYSEVKPTDIPRDGEMAAWQKTEEVCVSIRELNNCHMESRNITYLRSKDQIADKRVSTGKRDDDGMMLYEDKPREFVYIPVDSLAKDTDHISGSKLQKMEIIRQLTGKETIVIGRSKIKYFTKHIEFSDAYFEEVVSTKDAIKKLQACANAASIKALWGSTEFTNIVKHFPRLIPASLKYSKQEYDQGKAMTFYNIDIASLVPSVGVRDLKQEFDHLLAKVIFKKYPLLKGLNLYSSWLFDGSYKGDKKPYTDYIKMIDAAKRPKKSFSKKRRVISSRNSF